MSDLVKRLREWRPAEYPCEGDASLIAEAAARIEQLELERAEAMAWMQKSVGVYRDVPLVVAVAYLCGSLKGATERADKQSATPGIAKSVPAKGGQADG